MGNSKLTCINSVFRQFANTYGDLSLLTDGERLYLRTNAGRQHRQVTYPIEARQALVDAMNTRDYRHVDSAEMQRIKDTISPYTAYYQPGDESLVDLMFFSPLVYEAKPAREPRRLKYCLYDIYSPTDEVTVLDEGEAREDYIYRKAIELREKRLSYIGLIIKLWNEKTERMEKVYQVHGGGRFHVLDANGNAIPGEDKFLNADGITFTKLAECDWDFDKRYDQI